MARTFDDKRVYDAYIAGRQSAALAAAVRVELFDLLDVGALAPEQIAARLGLHPRGVQSLRVARRADRGSQKTPRRPLDIHGGSGALSIALARGYVAAAGLSGRVTALAGDMSRDPVPADHDVHLFSQILHDWPPETCRALLERSFAALPAAGRVLVHEKLVGPGTPLANALVDLDMLVWTAGQQWDFEGLRALLEVVGFRDTAVRETSGYWSAVWARKP